MIGKSRLNGWKWLWRRFKLILQSHKLLPQQPLEHEVFLHNKSIIITITAHNLVLMVMVQLSKANIMPIHQVLAPSRRPQVGRFFEVRPFRPPTESPVMLLMSRNQPLFVLHTTKFTLERHKSTTYLAMLVIDCYENGLSRGLAAFFKML